MSAKLFVGNLSYQATEEDLRELFQQAGAVQSVRIVTDQFTGRPRGFGFVEMSTQEEATRAVDQLNGRVFRDRNLVVDQRRSQAGAGSGGRLRGEQLVGDNRGTAPSAVAASGNQRDWPGRGPSLARLPVTHEHPWAGHKRLARLKGSKAERERARKPPRYAEASETALMCALLRRKRVDDADPGWRTRTGGDFWCRGGPVRGRRMVLRRIRSACTASIMELSPASAEPAGGCRWRPRRGDDAS